MQLCPRFSCLHYLLGIHFTNAFIARLTFSLPDLDSLCPLPWCSTFACCFLHLWLIFCCRMHKDTLKTFPFASLVKDFCWRSHLKVVLPKSNLYVLFTQSVSDFMKTLMLIQYILSTQHCFTRYCSFQFWASNYLESRREWALLRVSFVSNLLPYVALSRFSLTPLPLALHIKDLNLLLDFCKAALWLRLLLEILSKIGLNWSQLRKYFPNEMKHWCFSVAKHSYHSFTAPQ